jgi:hypothetical protein
LLTRIRPPYVHVLGWAALGLFCVAAGVAVSRAGAGLSNSEATVLTWAAAVALGVVAWLTLRHRTLVGLVLVCGFTLFGMAAALLYQPTHLDFRGANSAVATFAEYTPGYHYLVTFLVAALAIYIASLVTSLLFIERRPAAFSTAFDIHLSPKLLGAATLPLLALIIGTGVHTIFHANAYLEHTGPLIGVRVGHALGSAGILVCGYFCFAERHRATAVRWAAVLIAVAYELVFFATATRYLALAVPLIFVGGVLSGAWTDRQRKVGALVTIVIAIFALQLPLALRALPEHGLLPGIHYLTHDPSVLFGRLDPVNNFLFGAPLTLYVGHQVRPLPSGDLGVSLSPVPSQFNSWYKVAPTLRLNPTTPYSALGELLNQGWVIYFAVVALLGAGFVLAESIALRASAIRRGLNELIVYGGAGLFIVQSTEYNLRTASRLVYYTIVVVLVVTLVGQALSGRRGESGPDGASPARPASVGPEPALVGE